jgi:putative DNA primase/helicase
MARIGAPSPEGFPSAMRGARRWINWRYHNGKKPPCTPDGTPMSNWKDPDNWLTWEQAADHMADNPDLMLGFVLGADDEGAWVGVDLDKCRDPETGETVPAAKGLLGFLAGAYVEVSPSGTGYKAFGRGSAPEWVEVNYATDPPTLGGDRAVRFFAVTGKDGQGDPTSSIDLSTVKAVLAPGEATPGEEEKPKRFIMPESVAPGTQNATLFRAAVKYTKEGMTPEEVFPIIKALQVSRCPSQPGETPWTDADIQAIVSSASRYGEKEDKWDSDNVSDARAFAHLHGDMVRFDKRTGRWLIYDGTRWAPDKVNRVREMAVDTMEWRKMAAARIEDPAVSKAKFKWAAGGLNSGRLDNLLKEAAALPGIVTSGEEWDADPWLLGVTNGVVDLRTGQFRKGRPEDNITKQCAFPWDPDATAELWKATVADIFQDHPDLVPYFQTVLGYGLTGDCREEVFFLLVGEGRNGKGTLVNTVEAILGDYTASLSMRSLEATKHGQGGGAASPDIAKLAGARFVTASETSGGKFNAGLLKNLTGRDRITARHLHRDEFSFIPQLKLFLSLNEKPSVDDTSDGFWSRPHILPFLQCYLGREDRTLKDRLLVEGSGILKWMVEGCLKWQEDTKLLAPACVTEEKEAYRQSQKPLADFFEEKCILDPSMETASSQLFEEYRLWCDEARIYGDRRMSGRAFGKALSKEEGLTARKASKGRRVWTGIGVRAEGREF